MRQNEEARRISAEDMDYEQIMAAGLRPYDLTDDFQEVLPTPWTMSMCPA